MQRLQARHIEVIDVSDAVLKACSDTETPQGLIAVIEPPRLDWPRAPHLIVIADRLRDPGNLGTLLRSSAASRGERGIARAGNRRGVQPQGGARRDGRAFSSADP